MSFEHNDMKHLPINLENYEEYFLLYVDNELTEAEKKDVVLFAEQHPELKEELMMLMDTKLAPEDMPMDRKHELFRSEDHSAINTSNYEELQLSWLDDELDEKQKNAIESYTREHAEARTNFEWLKKAKLPEEHIVFPDKSLLYRSIEKPAAVISIKWYRMAVAAAILIAAGLWFINRPDEEEIPAELITVAQEVPKETNTVDNKAAMDSGESTSSEPGNNVTTDQTNNTAVEQNNHPIADQVNIKGTENSNGSEIAKNVRIAGNEKNIRTTNSQQENSNKTIDYTSNVNSNLNEKSTTIVPGQVEKITQKNIDNVADVATDPMVATSALKTQTAKVLNVKTNYATEALLQENNESLDDQQETEEGRNRKGMFRGIVRKANRIYNKATNPDPGRATVKVANFEIGLPR